ncbi:hypothetical protein MKW92_029307 [Papaver armeniacum]|nr:hypothetical protein MKW92_046094 [Papaver armeniacum]KAI3968391.1 hypothetical protein MKW92_029307 [Papaver armeniacum]
MKTLIGDGFLCVMCNSQYYIYKQLIGGMLIFPIFVFLQLIYTLILLILSVKRIGMDMWNVAMERRDKKLLGKLYAIFT